MKSKDTIYFFKFINRIFKSKIAFNDPYFSLICKSSNSNRLCKENHSKEAQSLYYLKDKKRVYCIEAHSETTSEGYEPRYEIKKRLTEASKHPNGDNWFSIQLVRTCLARTSESGCMMSEGLEYHCWN